MELKHTKVLQDYRASKWTKLLPTYRAAFPKLTVNYCRKEHKRKIRSEPISRKFRSSCHRTF